MVYNNKHKIVLQTIIHKCALKEDDAKILIIKLFDHNNITQIIGEINAKLQHLNLTIKCINCEVSNQLYWVLASTIQDTIARFYLEYSQAELALLRNIYSEIITSNNGYVSSTWCLNLCSSLNLKLSKTKAEEFLNDINKRKWLSCKHGKYYMGVRSIAEMLQYFKETYEDNLRNCSLCKQTIFYGEKCKQCDTITHIHCLKTYTMGRSSLKCPNCHHSMTILDDSGHNSNSAMDLDSTDIDEIDAISQYSQKRRN